MSADISLLVVGGGPAGTTAALQASELGGQVTLLEAGQIGGTSLNRGPAPVWTLARAARLARDWSSWATFGLDGPAPVPDLAAVMAGAWLCCLVGVFVPAWRASLINPVDAILLSRTQ